MHECTFAAERSVILALHQVVIKSTVYTKPTLKSSERKWSLQSDRTCWNVHMAFNLPVLHYTIHCTCLCVILFLYFVISICQRC